MADLPIPDAHAADHRLILVERAVARLREGGPVCLSDGSTRQTMQAVETAGTVAAGSVLVLAASRAAGLGVPVAAGPVAFGPVDGADAATLLAWADPTKAASALPPTLVAPSLAAPALQLAKLARLLPAVLLSPATDPAGHPGGDPAVDAADILAHPALAAGRVVRISEAAVPLAGIPECRIVAFRSPGSALEHLAILVGDPAAQPAPLVRVHSECFTGDLLGSLRCDCGPQLHGALQRIAAEGAGAVLYLAQEGRGIGLANKLRAYTLQDRGMDTLDANRALGFDADERDYRLAAAMLRDLGLNRVRLLTNNPDKLASLHAHGIELAGRVSLLFAANGVNDGYLRTKATRFGHLPG